MWKESKNNEWARKQLTFKIMAKWLAQSIIEKCVIMKFILTWFTMVIRGKNNDLELSSRLTSTFIKVHDCEPWNHK
jgi:hypothetical protein